MRYRAFALAVLCIAAVAITGCAGNGNGLDSNGRPPDSGGSGGRPLTADFQSIQDHVFTPVCTVCHAGASAPQGLRLDAVNSYDLLVGVPSTEVPSTLRVKAGDPDRSYLIQKLEGHAAVGAQMPFGEPPLPAATIAVIRQWITDGAQRSATAVAENAFAIAVASPATGDVVAQPLLRIVIAFTHELDQTRVDATTFQLLRIDAGGGTETTQSVVVDVSTADANPYALILTPRQPLEAGRYRVMASGPPATELSDLAGRRLGDGAVASAADQAVTSFDVESMP
jgi:hypothetical protein